VTTEAEKVLSMELQSLAKKLTVMLEKRAGKPMLFSLVIFNEEPGSRMQYVSNTERECVTNALKSLLIAWGQGMPDIPAHKVN
jgi:hypothetical protein